MTSFKIGDVVRIKNKDELVDLIVRGIAEGFYKCVSTCGYFEYSKAACDLELVHRPDPQADLKQAIREVLLSDEFMTAFAAAFMKTPLPIAMPSTKRDQELIESLRDYSFGEPANATPSGLCCGGPESDPDNFGECGHCGNMLCGRLQKAAEIERQEGK